MSEAYLGFVAGPVAFAAGLVVGSFLNVVIVRGLRGETLGGRSHCDTCGTVLKARELIPLVSFIIQRGRCRHCDTTISIQHPLVEFGTAVAYAVAAVAIVSFVPVGSVLLFAAMVFPAIGALIVLIVSDIRFQILPDGPVIVLALAGLATSIMRESVVYDLAAALVAALFFAALWFFSAGAWMGFGDAKLALATSLAVGFPASIAALLFSFWLGGIVGILLIAAGRKDLQSRIPFGPFLIAGALAAFVWAPSFFSYTGLSQFPIFESKGILGGP